jgi:hypothetical protein
MNFPVWNVPLLGGGMLIAIIAILHVFVAHFAVGGGLFLVWSEARAYQAEDEGLLRYVRQHSTFFVLLVLVFGAVVTAVIARVADGTSLDPVGIALITVGAILVAIAAFRRSDERLATT